MKKTSFRFFLALSFLLAGYSFSFAESQTQRFVLENGMTVLIQEIPDSPVVAVQALVKNGSATEREYLGCGLSHFIEHMMFKGTQKRTVGQISKEVKALGGHINASTSFDYTFYTLELPQGQFSKGLDILSDMLVNSVFDAEEVEKEREVILGEMRLYKDRPENFLNELVFENAYTRHPYKFPIIGYEPLFKSVTRDELFDFYKNTHIPNNIIVTIAGNLNGVNALEEIKEAFKDFKPRPFIIRNLPAESSQLLARRIDREYATQLTRMSIVFQGVGILNNDMMALDVLAMILGQGESSRLVKELYKNKRIVDSISAHNFTPMDQGLFEINCLLDEKNIDIVLNEIKKQIELIKSQGVSTKELEKSKRQVLSRYVFDRQQAADISFDAALNEAMTGDFNFSKQYVEGVKNIRSADIKRVANKYLNDFSSTTVIVKPKKESEAQAVLPALQGTFEIKKIVLDNGMTLLLKEDHRFPLVSMRLTLRGGVLADAKYGSGISEIMSSLWNKGTKARSVKQIAESTEMLGMNVGSFSGQNSFGLKADCLSQDIDFTIELLTDIMKNPTFPPEEILQQKEQMETAIRQRDDSISSSTSLRLKQILFAGHPYQNDSLGSLESVNQITREKIIAFYRELVVPENMVLAVIGDFDAERISRRLQNEFSLLKNTEIKFDFSKPLPLARPAEEVMFMDKTQAMVTFGFQGAEITNADRYGLEILMSILGSPLSGRMFTQIRDELGQAYTLGAQSIPGMGTGFIYGYVLTTDENIEKVKQILLKQVSELTAGVLTDEELQSTKTYLKGVHHMSLETGASLAMTIALDELYGLGFSDYANYDQNIDRVSREDLVRIAKTYLDLQKIAIVATRPEASQSDRAPAEVQK
ncbi:MAG: pitrilysin family protein [Candidatus Omnitrophota bacterium]